MATNYLGKSMADTVHSIYERLYHVLCVHTKLNMLAMTALQSMGYNGFKRWHRYRSRQFFEMKLCLRNELYDKFRITADFKDADVSYSPSSMEEHLKAWEGALLEAIQELGNISKDYYEVVGVNCEKAKCAMHKMMRDYEKVGRYLKRFTESDWLTLDMHIVDDALHAKYKAKEEEHGYKY